MGVTPSEARRTSAFFLAAFLTACILSPSARADIVRLKSGKVLEGTITEEDASSVSIDLGKAFVKVPMERVDWVARGTKDEIARKAKAGRAYLDGVAALKAIDFKKAASLLEEAQAYEPNDPKIKANLAYAYAHASMPAKAAVLYRQALDANPGDRKLRLNLVSAYTDAGQFLKAAGVLHQMLRDFPREKDVYERLSLVFHKAEMYTQSVRYAKKAKTLPAA